MDQDTEKQAIYSPPDAIPATQTSINLFRSVVNSDFQLFIFKSLSLYLLGAQWCDYFGKGSMVGIAGQAALYALIAMSDRGHSPGNVWSLLLFGVLVCIGIALGSFAAALNGY